MHVDKHHFPLCRAINSSVVVWLFSLVGLLLSSSSSSSSASSASSVSPAVVVGHTIYKYLCALCVCVSVFVVHYYSRVYFKHQPSLAPFPFSFHAYNKPMGFLSYQTIFSFPALSYVLYKCHILVYMGNETMFWMSFAFVTQNLLSLIIKYIYI